jgi:hypothetical protein
MRPQVGKRSQYNKFREEEKPPTPTKWYVERNTHTNIVMKRDFMYIEDAKDAININTLEQRIKLIRWLKTELKQHSKEQLIEVLERMEDKDRHTLQKRFKISI